MLTAEKHILAAVNPQNQDNSNIKVYERDYGIFVLNSENKKSDRLMDRIVVMQPTIKKPPEEEFYEERGK